MGYLERETLGECVESGESAMPNELKTKNALIIYVSEELRELALDLASPSERITDAVLDKLRMLTRAVGNTALYDQMVCGNCTHFDTSGLTCVCDESMMCGTTVDGLTEVCSMWSEEQ